MKYKNISTKKLSLEGFLVNHQQRFFQTHEIIFQCAFNRTQTSQDMRTMDQVMNVKRELHFISESHHPISSDTSFSFEFCSFSSKNSSLGPILMCEDFEI